ncbi:MAG: ribonuclease P protein component [Rhodoluna sp.]
MLARENRLKSAEDFRSTMRTGRKAVGNSMVLYLKQNDDNSSARFGFVVSKAVGSAVQRNLVKRRLRSAVRDRLPKFRNGQAMVIRALPAAIDLTWQALGEDLDSCLDHLSK